MESKKINISNLISLCYILDSYESFNENLKEFISSDYNRDDIEELYRFSKKPFKKCSKKTKSFYRINKDVIETINKYFNIRDFINYNYDYQGKIWQDSSINYFYQYLLRHREKLDKIIAVLMKLKELGFEKITLEEDKKFEDKAYKVDTNFSNNVKLGYLDNMQLLLNHHDDIIRYKTVDSPYEITIKISLQNKAYNNEITLNTLIFNPERLPDNISKKYIFKKLIDLKTQKLKISAYDLAKELHDTIAIFDEIEEIDNKEELKTILLNIRQDIEHLNSLISKPQEIKLAKKKND